GRPGVRDPGRERIQRLLAQLAGHFRRDDVLPHHQVPLGHREQTVKILAVFAVAFLSLATARATEPPGEARAGEARPSERRPPAPEGDWSRFRGPNGTGVAETSALPSAFGPTTNVTWKTAVPQGHSSPVLMRTHIFMTGVDGSALIVLALDRATGRE